MVNSSIIEKFKGNTKMSHFEFTTWWILIRFFLVSIQKGEDRNFQETKIYSHCLFLLGNYWGHLLRNPWLWTGGIIMNCFLSSRREKIGKVIGYLFTFIIRIIWSFFLLIYWEHYKQKRNNENNSKYKVTCG